MMPEGADDARHLTLVGRRKLHATARHCTRANEVFVTFATTRERESRRALGLIPYSRKRIVALMDLTQLSARLAVAAGIGEPDYADEGMIQYLRTERVVAPYQRKGIKVIELVRIYRAGTNPAGLQGDRGSTEK
jgi:hypothetical protein